MASPSIFWIGMSLAACSTAYSLIALCAVSIRIRPSRTSPHAPGVTIFKPLCGTEPETYDCLRSFCNQNYPTFQIIFGVADSSDPVVAIVERLILEFPQRELRLVVNRRQHGTSRKVSNLINMMPLARHDCFVVADSDIRVAQGYLEQIVAPLVDKNVGIVTCTYRGIARNGFWPLLGAQFINEWFMPSVRVAALVGSRSFAFGASIAICRDALSRIGGFTALVDQLADDYRLGEMTRRLGLRTVLSQTVVDTHVVEESFNSLVQRELRWLRTIRAVRPIGYGLSLITFSVPMTAISAMLVGGGNLAMAMVATVVAARVFLHLKTRGAAFTVLPLLAVPIRDVLSLGLWGLSFFSREVRWRSNHYGVRRDGTLESKAATIPGRP